MPLAPDSYDRLVGAVYDAALDPGRWSGALSEVMTGLDGSGAALLVTAPDSNRMQHVAATLDAGASASYNRYYGRLDHMVDVVADARSGEIIASDAVVPRADLLKREFFNDWMRPHDFGDGLFLVLGGAEAPAWLAIGAPARADSYASRERVDLLRRLAPHLGRAIALQRAVPTGDGLGALLAWHGARPAAMLGANGRFLQGSAAFDDLLRAGRLVLDHGRIRAAADPVVARRFDRAIAAATAADGGPRRGAALVLPAEAGLGLVLHLSPVSAELAASVCPSALALLVVIDPARAVRLPAALLRAEFGLTPAEIEIARGIVNGDGGLKAVADALGISISTARSHLASIFAKTGLHRQSELVRLLVTLAGAS